MTNSLSMSSKLALLALATVVYLIGLWPSWSLRDAVLSAAGNPPYAGLWLFIPHVLLYSTLAARVAGAAWFSCVRAKWLTPPRFALNASVALWSTLGAAFGLGLVVAVIFVMGQQAALRYIPPNPWSIAGNVFSNFYEEFIFRGFILAALAAVFGFWPAVLVSSLAWAALHTQYPLPLRAAVFGVGAILAGVLRLTKTLTGPYAAHMMLDIVADSFIA